MPSTGSLFAEYFGPILGLPSWNVTAEYGSWVRMQFGGRHERVIKALPGSKSPSLRRGFTVVKGDFELWIEMAAWELHNERKRISHSEQSRTSLRRTARRLEGLKLTEVRLSPGPISTEFLFDDGLVLTTQPTTDADADDPLWHLYVNGNCLTYLANNRLQYGNKSDSAHQSILIRSATHVAYQRDEALRTEG